MNTTKKLNVASSRLERHVQTWLNTKGQDYQDGWQGALKDLLYGGCQAGTVSHLIYYTDTVKFFQTHRREISELLKESIESTGLQPAELFGDKWDAEDPLAQEQFNRNLLAWFGFEETARKLADRAGVEA